MATLREHIWFSQTGLTHAKRELLLESFGSPAEIFSAEGMDFAGIQGITRADISLLANKSLEKTEKIIEDCAKHSISIITRQDTAYPSRLLDIGDPPQVIYVLGNLPDMDSVLPIAVVGTRRPNSYGLYMADLIGGQLARAGALVVSGMALGIDSAANRAALEAGRPTVAVMGCGADICYPPAERRLWEEIAQKGAIISEYPPGTPPYGANFLERNRIISGLSLAVTLINVAARSGAINTANHALRQGREVFCVPANVDSGENEGITKLLKSGAGIVENASDILEGFQYMFTGLDMQAAADRRGKIPHRPEQKNGRIGYSQRPPQRQTSGRGDPSIKIVKPAEPRKTEPEKSPQGLNLPTAPSFEGAKGKIFELLRTGRLMHIDKICDETELSAAEALSELMMLEIEGYVSSFPGKFFKITG